jgi:hypothetical protein
MLTTISPNRFFDNYGKPIFVRFSAPILQVLRQCPPQAAGVGSKRPYVFSRQTENLTFSHFCLEFFPYSWYITKVKLMSIFQFYPYCEAIA